ncbi:hypothetical protein [Actinocorallia populi]|uniref:hypothetical protein n=1 Tax=Actinocorallia populi TaxID=2079200 RepID=UPI000D089209|nr:hypothetical protein [Actinocorallia populi]
MEIHLTFSKPQEHDGRRVCELDVSADRLVIGDGTLRALDKGSVVGEVALADIAVIDLPGRRSVSALRERHPNAYRPWTSEEDARLLALLEKGEPLESLTRHFGRGKNAILGRLYKLEAFKP